VAVGPVALVVSGVALAVRVVVVGRCSVQVVQVVQGAVDGALVGPVVMVGLVARVRCLAVVGMAAPVVPVGRAATATCWVLMLGPVVLAVTGEPAAGAGCFSIAAGLAVRAGPVGPVGPVGGGMLVSRVGLPVVLVGLGVRVGRVGRLRNSSALPDVGAWAERVGLEGWAVGVLMGRYPGCWVGWVQPGVPAVSAGLLGRAGLPVGRVSS
jgi:hypothetical protein